ncbi:2-C-methyl-D-erythritol 4-phosphate cytidylyltransferase [Pseudomonas sp. Marseille-QA0892]
MGQPSLPSFWAVIPAAGIGSRMRADRPKQYLQVSGLTILEHTINCFSDHPTLEGIVVSVAEEDPYWQGLACATRPDVIRASGGAERAVSVLNALLLLAERGAHEDDWVLVHDAARPNLQREDLDRLLAAVGNDAVGGILAAPVRDTLKRAGVDGRVEATLDRSLVWQAFTPQMFRLGLLQTSIAEALAAGVNVTDEASALEWAGYAPRLVEGRGDNLKITRPDDLEWLERHWAH